MNSSHFQRRAGGRGTKRVNYLHWVDRGAFFNSALSRLQVRVDEEREKNKEQEEVICFIINYK